MIPHQPLYNRKGLTMSFLNWVRFTAIPPEQMPPLADTREQLLHIFFDLVAVYGLRLPPSAKEFEAFKTQCHAPHSLIIRQPRLYLKSEDQPDTYLCFDYQRWIEETGYLL